MRTLLRKFGGVKRGNQRGGFFNRAVCRDDDVRPARLFRRVHLAAQAVFRFLAGEAVACHQAGKLRLAGERRAPDRVAQPVQPSFVEQRHVQHADFRAALLRAEDFPFNHLPQERLHQVIQRMTALVAGEDKAAQRAAVKRAVRVENLAAEFCTNRGQCQPARLRQRAGELVAVDDGGAERFQRERNGGFSTGNTACQTDDAHENIPPFGRAGLLIKRISAPKDCISIHAPHAGSESAKRQFCLPKPYALHNKINRQ